MPAQKSKKEYVPKTHPSVFIAAVLLSLFLIYPFIVPLILAVITAYVFRPIVKRLERHTRSYHLALGILVIIIGIPIIALALYISANSVQVGVDIAGVGNTLKEIIAFISQTIASSGLEKYTGYILGAQDITAQITAFAISVASDFVKGIPMYLLDFVIYLYATYQFMIDGHKVVGFIKSYAATLPSEDKHFMFSILSGLKRSFDVLFFSYITMSLIISAVSFVGYSILGVPHSFILAILTGLFGFLPVFGAWMIYVPAAAFMYFAGNVIGAAGVLIFGVLVLNVYIPVILQPYLGAKKSGASPLTILLGFFAGPVIFGAKGLLLGPILFVMAETIIVEYIQYRIAKATHK